MFEFNKPKSGFYALKGCKMKSVSKATEETIK